MGKIFAKYKLEIFFWVGLVVLYFATRFINLTVLPIFADEAIYIHWSQIIWHDATQRFIPLTDGKPPLHMWLMIPFLKVIADPLLAGRLFSVVAGLVTLVGTFFLAREFFGKKVGYLAAILVIFSPFLLFNDRMALSDSLLTSTGVWSLYLTVLLVKYKRLDLSLILGVFWGAALLTKPPAMIFPAFTVLVLLLFFRFEKNWQLNFLKTASFFLLSFIVAQAIYNILRLSPYMHLINIRSRDYLLTKKEILEAPLAPILRNFPTVFDWFSAYLTWPILVLFLISAFYILWQKNRAGILLLVWVVIPVFFQLEIARVMYSRYFLFVFPQALILAALVLNIIFEKLKDFKWQVLVLIFFLSFSFYFDARLLTNPSKAPFDKRDIEQYLTTWSAGHGIKESADYIKNKLGGGKKVTVATEGYFGTLPDGLQVYLDEVRNIEIYGIGQPVFNLPDKVLEAADDYPTYLLVNQTRIFIKGDPRLKLLAAYPKRYPDDTYLEALLLYEVLPSQK